MELGNGRSSAVFALLILSLVLVINIKDATGQTGPFDYFYRVYFRDKGDKPVTEYQPLALLSERAVARRQKAGIPLLDIRDLPVNAGYIDQISSMGLVFHCASKWMNTALFKTSAEADIASLTDLDFVTNVTIVKRPAGKSNYGNKLDLSLSADALPPYDNHIAMLNGYGLKNSGFNGRGILIAVLDGGFTNTDKVPGLAYLRERDGIKATRDFVRGQDFVYDYSNHGTAVLTVLAGLIDGELAGISPDADYLLLRTENGASEFPVEEDFWAAGAEYADSCGADIISTSLGYYVFDAPEMNYTFADMDGNSTFVTRAADIAASKGILVAASAGNERNKQWIRIIAPSDGDSVLCAGAVDGNRAIATFSSAGPSADGRIKPDNTAQGVSVVAQILEDGLSRVNGTSFSCPVLSGFCACLMQAFPGATSTDIITALRNSSDRFASPDSLYGYGIPNISTAAETLQGDHIFMPEKESVASPNPFTDKVEITFRESPGMMTLEIFSSSGKKIVSRKYNEYISRRLVIDDLQNAAPGLYILRMKTSEGTFTHKVIKTGK